jgi:hypothetical protein
VIVGLGFREDKNISRSFDKLRTFSKLAKFGKEWEIS